MKNRIEIFKENPILGGFSIAVRDDWSFKIKRIHISVEEKEAFQKQFDNQILLESEFMQWWLNFRQEKIS